MLEAPPAENETNGYIFIHAEGGLNQQRIAVCFIFFTLIYLSASQLSCIMFIVDS